MGTSTNNASPVKQQMPTVDGYYWVLVAEHSAPQVVWICRGKVHFTGLAMRLSAAQFATEYPRATWGELLPPPPLVAQPRFRRDEAEAVVGAVEQDPERFDGYA